MDTQGYWRDGYVFPTPVMTAREAGEARTELELLLDRWSDHPALMRPLTDYCRGNFNLVTRWGSRIARQPGILDAVEQILGPNFVCWMSEVIIKAPNSAKLLSMHQDFTYWGMDDGDKGLTAWLALTPATVDNGCMHFVRASHVQGQVQHNDTFSQDNLLSRGQEVAVDYDEADVEHCCLQPGEVSLHHSLTFHGSGPNRTDEPRIGVVMRYLSTDIQQVIGSRNHGVLVRGTDHADNFVLLPEPLEDFSRESMALHEKVTLEQDQHFAAGAAEKPRFVTQ